MTNDQVGCLASAILVGSGAIGMGLMAAFGAGTDLGAPFIAAVVILVGATSGLGFLMNMRQRPGSKE